MEYKIDISEIQRIKDFKINNWIIIIEEFIEKYIEIINLKDKKLRKRNL